MINPVFFISKDVPLSGDYDAGEENVFYSIEADPSDKEKLLEIYQFAVNSKQQLSLTLSVSAEPKQENLQIILSFFFLASYLRIDNNPVINIIGKELHSLKEYSSSQGFEEIVVNNSRIVSSAEEAVQCYKELLHSENVGIQALLVPKIYEQDVLKRLKMEEANVSHLSFIKKYQQLEKEMVHLRRKNLLNEKELEHQQQYQDVLRSQHATRELQDYYNHEYEVLPKWYKQFGHLLKVIMGKRTFKSLFRDNVKKYKD